MSIVCVEFALNAIPLPEYTHPENALYIFGPEEGSIDQALIDKADDVVYVPTVGCMNLSASVNVLLYDRLSKAGNYNASNTLIRENRDTNNRLKVL
jgi:tRNA(Leu) C34 or U34 (ribose-2'-O)-methylase TrmL